MSLSATDFDYVRNLVKERSAIVLEPSKTYLVDSRLTPLVRKQNLASLGELVARLRSERFGELHRSVIEAMTTNETSFFRDVHPFEAFKKKILPELIAKRSAERALTIWCGACSSGQEPYSIAMLLRDSFPELAAWRVQIVATDLYAKIKPPAELRSQTVQGSVALIKKVRDQPELADRLGIAVNIAARTERLKPGLAYKLKVYCNELFAGELLLKHDGQARTDKLDLNPVDLAPGENSLEVRLVEVTEQGDLYLETDNNQLIGMLATDRLSNDRSAQIKVILGDGQNAQVVQLK